MPISIGLPFLNNEATLANTIRSVFAQTYEDWELILADDGSTDRSLEIARSVNDPRVRVLSDGQRRRLAARLNQITAEAQYDLVARMDADDIMFPERLELQRKAFENPTINLTSSGMCNMTSDNTIVSLQSDDPRMCFFAEHILSRRHCINHVTVMARKSWFLQNPYDESCKVAQDFELWARTCANGHLSRETMGYQDEPLVFRQLDGASTPQKISDGELVRRSCCLRYGPGTMGWPKTLAHVLTDWTRTKAIHLLSGLGLFDFYVNLRNRGRRIGIHEIEQHLLEHYQTVLKRTTSTKVPGLDF